MAKLTAPLLSMGAQGQIGDSIVFSKWKGIPYARQKVIPANPRTVAQQSNRTTFALLREMYKLAPATLREPWSAFASGRKFTGMNAFVGENLRVVKGDPDLSDFLGSPGARGGLPPATVAVVAGAGAGEVDVTVTPPDQLPVGWAVEEVAAAAFENQDPSGIFSAPLVAAVEPNPANPITLGGFDSAITVLAVGWVVYTKPDGSKAYSVSLSGTAVTT